MEEYTERGNQNKRGGGGSPTSFRACPGATGGGFSCACLRSFPRSRSVSVGAGSLKVTLRILQRRLHGFWQEAAGSILDVAGLAVVSIASSFWVSNPSSLAKLPPPRGSRFLPANQGDASLIEMMGWLTGDGRTHALCGLPGKQLSPVFNHTTLLLRLTALTDPEGRHLNIPAIRMRRSTNGTVVPEGFWKPVDGGPPRRASPR